MHTFEPNLARAGMGARLGETNRRGLAREPRLRLLVAPTRSHTRTRYTERPFQKAGRPLRSCSVANEHT